MDPLDSGSKRSPPGRKVGPPVPPGEAAARFLASMPMNFDMWHDGTGYDLGALKEIPAAELPGVVAMLIAHLPRDWRDIEALAQIDLPAAREVVVAALKDPDAKVRREALTYASDKADPVDREKRVLKALKTCVAYEGLTETLDEAEALHTPAIIEALLKGALTREGETAVHFVALLYYLHGKAAEAFDWNHRPFFLRFHTEVREERRAAFRELCHTIGVDPAPYLRS